jgi:YVTN family beta-propeller protein
MARRRGAVALGAIAGVFLLALAGCSAGQAASGAPSGTPGTGSAGLPATDPTATTSGEQDGGTAAERHRVGDTIAEVQLTGNPLNVAPGFGSLWVSVTQDTGGLLVRIDPGTQQIVASIPVGGFPVGIAVAAGSLWVTSYDDGTLARVDPATNKVVVTIPVGPGPAQLAVDAGMIWVGNSAGSITRVDPAANRRVQVVTVGAGVQFRAVAAGDGSVWTTVKGTGLSRLDSATGRILASIPIPHCCEGDLLVTRDLVWVTDQPSAMIYAVDPATNRVVRRFRAEPGARGLALAGGNLWVTHGDTGLVTWRSPDTGRRLGSAQLRGFVGGMAATDERSIWVQGFDLYTVVRLTTG